MYTKIKTLSRVRPNDKSRNTMNASVGVLAILSPLVLTAGSALFSSKIIVQPSISHYYYTEMGMFFIVSLSIFAALTLFGKTESKGEKLWMTTAGICALGTVCFPTMPVNGTMNLIYTAHLFFALSLFISVSILAIRYFSKSIDGRSAQMYKWSGIGLIISLLSLVAFFVIVLSSGGHTVDYNTVFLIESFMMILLGFIWVLRSGLKFK